ncbi:hypothetical protein H9P43_001161 [Blastocladiella emersonii ATCC 22665]|nr:hypothetical protein H9P43_001161 [Blastocladiella emersonii ATCC 22665]
MSNLGHIHPLPGFGIQPVRINDDPQVVYAIVHEGGILYYPLVMLCMHLPKVNGDSVYNKVRKRIQRDSRRMVVDDDDLTRYRKISHASRNVVKIFYDLESLLELARDLNIPAKFDIIHAGPVLTNMDEEWFPEPLEGETAPSADAEGNQIEGDNPMASDEPAPAEVKQEESADESDRPARRRSSRQVTAESKKLTRQPAAAASAASSAAAAAAPAAAPATASAPAATSTSTRSARASSSAAAAAAAAAASASANGTAGTVQPAQPLIGMLFPPTEAWPQLFTPHTMEIKVMRSGQKPHFVHWTSLNPTDRFLVFKATIESKDLVLERKRPWIARFLSQEFDQDDFEHYETKLSFPIRAHIKAILDTATLPSDAELAAYAQADAAVASLKRRHSSLHASPAVQGGSSSKRRRAAADADFSATQDRHKEEAVADHLHLMLEAVRKVDMDDEKRDASGAREVLDNAKLTEDAAHNRNAVRALIASLGSFYYEVSTDINTLRDEIAELRKVRDASHVTIKELQDTVARLQAAASASAPVSRAETPLSPGMPMDIDPPVNLPSPNSSVVAHTVAAQHPLASPPRASPHASPNAAAASPKPVSPKPASPMSVSSPKVAAAAARPLESEAVAPAETPAPTSPTRSPAPQSPAKAAASSPPATDA